MKKFILVSATPRKGGNSEIAVETVERRIRERMGDDAEVVLFKMSERSVGCCLACDACQECDGQSCVQRDDMSALLPAIEESDGVILASPVYNQMLSAQAVAFIDRFYPFYSSGDPLWSNSKKRDKKAAVIVVSWGNFLEAYGRLASEAARGFCQIGAVEYRSLAFGGVKDRGELLGRADYLSELTDLADWLVEG